MFELDVDEMIAHIPSRKELSKNGFPYAGCRKLLLQAGEAAEDLIPWLDLYTADIAGYLSSVRNIRSWTVDRKNAARKDLAHGFYERFSELRVLQSLITPENAPDVYDYYLLHEHARELLLAILAKLD